MVTQVTTPRGCDTARTLLLDGDSVLDIVRVIASGAARNQFNLKQDIIMENPRSGSPAFTAGFSGNGEGALHSASASAHEAVSSVAGAAEDAVRKAKPGIDRVAAMAHQAVDSAAGVAAPTADWLAGQGEHLKAAQKKLLDDTCRYVAANPLKSVGMAVVAGLVIGRIILR